MRAIACDKTRRGTRDERRARVLHARGKKEAPFGHVGCDRTRRGWWTHLLAAVAVVHAEEGGVVVQAEYRGVRVLRPKAGVGFGERRLTEGGVGRSCGGRGKPFPRRTGVGAEGNRNFAVRDARAAARRGTRSPPPAIDTTTLTYLHIRAPSLHRRSAVLEPPILPVGALLVRDGLTQIRPHRDPPFLSAGRRR